MNERTGFIWLDGQIINWQDAKVHVLTHGLHYASSVFEGIRVYNSLPFMIEEHLIRLFKSAELLDMNISFTKEDLVKAILELIALNNIKNGYIRPLVFRGSEEIKIAAPNNTIRVAIAIWETPDSYIKPRDLSKGYKLKIGKWRRPPSISLPHESKCAGGYTIGTLEKHDAMRKGFDDSLLLDIENNIAETTSANIFFIKDNKLYTPQPECFLNGLTRQLVIKLAKQNNIEVIERKISIDEISSFEDAFLTSTTLEILPINFIESHEFRRHDITTKLYKKFIEHANIVFAEV